MRYGCWVPGIASALRSASPRCGPSRLVCVDGPAGSGKTSLAAELAAELGDAPVVHLDDLYEGWSQPLGQPLAARVEAWLLLPWSVGLPGRHLRFDWGRDRFTSWVEVPAAPLLVLEGCGSGSAGIREYASAVVWVDAPAEECLRRGLARDGAALASRWRAWQEQEAAHFARDRTRAAATTIVNHQRTGGRGPGDEPVMTPQSTHPTGPGGIMP
ncbi:MAG: hypothetical protein WCF04_01955 [Candidatus Nanopelagicales bacterium]